MVDMAILPDRDAWLDNRMRGIGGSEIAAVVGMNPYMDNITLWELKTGRRKRDDISQKPYVQYGTQAETLLRELFRLDYPQYKVDYADNNSWHNPIYPWALASLDGWLTDEHGRRGVLEIKTSEIKSAAQHAKWDGRIPDQYYAQILMYMAVTEADFAVCKAQLKTTYDGDVILTTRHYHIERIDVQSDIDYLMEQGAQFWQHVERYERPPLVLPSI